jgi:ribosomal-protein-alanine N-acetyltransferase
LLIHLLDQAKTMEAVAVSLEVRVTNHAAQRMYGRFGFRPIGVRKNYYQEINEDALVMWTDDIRTEGYRRLLDGIRGSLPGGLGEP